MVQVEDWTVEESTEEGGLARFSLTFSAAREDPPFAVNEGGRLRAATGAVNKVAEANFLSKAQASVGGLAKGAAAFQAQVNGVVSQVVGGVQAFTDPLSSLARTPANLAASVLGGVNAIVASIENTRSAFTLLKQVIDRLQGRRTEGTSSANKAEQAMQSLFITAALGQMASQASQADWGNTQAARVAQTDLLASLDAEIERADAQTYGPLRDMRASAIQAIAQASAVQRWAKNLDVVGKRLQESRALVEGLVANLALRQPAFNPSPPSLMESPRGALPPPRFALRHCKKEVALLL